MMAALALFAEIGTGFMLAAAGCGQVMSRAAVIEESDRYNPDRSEESCLDVARGKTGELIALAARLGSMAAGASPAVQQDMAAFAMNLGLAYQLLDDVADLTSSTDTLGKPVNSDILNGIYTLPVLHALRTTPRLRELLRPDCTVAQAAAARELVLASGAIEHTLTMADDLLRTGESHLARCTPDTAERQGVLNYARSVLALSAPLPSTRAARPRPRTTTLTSSRPATGPENAATAVWQPPSRNTQRDR